MGSFFQIPGNIKQQFLPFVLNSKNNINYKPAGNSTELVDSSPQYFTYKNVDTVFKAGKGRLQFFPSSLNNIKIDDDISLKMLYPYQGDPAKSDKKQTEITVNSILDQIPGIQIREFLPDTRLDQCINLFIDFFKGMSGLATSDQSESGSSGGTNKKSISQKIEELSKKLTNAAWFTVKYMTGVLPDNLYTDLGNAAAPNFPGMTISPMSPDYYVLSFPYALYYTLQSCVTTNIYDVPGLPDDKAILHSGDGKAGWTGGGDDIMSAGGFRVSDFMKKIPLVGSLANMILGNIGINYLPWWNANSGTSTKEPEISIKFDLFNDSAEAALVNFIFVNTLVPNNKWIQYNMFQHSSSIYDVKINGINRLFACAGNFDVTYDGVLRTPSKEWVQTLVSAHVNPKYSANITVDSIIANNLIKIPDVYKVTMSFQSLLPANFNNFIYNYVMNTNIITEYQNVGYTPSVISKAIPKALTAFTGKLKKAWDNPDANNYVPVDE